MSVPARSDVIVHVRRGVVFFGLVRLAPAAVPVADRGVIVLVRVIVGVMLEFRERVLRVMVRDVVVIVGMDPRRMLVLATEVADDLLLDR